MRAIRYQSLTRVIKIKFIAFISHALFDIFNLSFSSSLSYKFFSLFGTDHAQLLSHKFSETILHSIAYQKDAKKSVIGQKNSV